MVPALVRCVNAAPNLAPRKRILFVDDEQSVLDGLKDRLSADRKRWEMLFASSGTAALSLMQQRPVDVVISDMRMPGMDGAQLLAQVRAEYPATARIVLTGHAEREAILRALPVAHQLLSKPCDTGALRVAIERTCDLQQMLQSETIRQVVGGLSHLPSVSRTYSRLTQAAGDRNSAIADFADIVASDPAMGSKVLQLTNSAYFGLSRSVTSIHQAVSYLGIELIKGLVLMGDLFGATSAQPIDCSTLEWFQERAFLTARVAKRLVPDRRRAEEAFTAGLLHDVGQFVLLQGMPDIYQRIVTDAKAANRPLHTVEKEQLGVTHAEVGAYLLGVWGLPFSIVESVARHHQPGLVRGGDREMLAAVHVADGLVNAFLGQQPNWSSALDHGFLKEAGFYDQLESWVRLAESEMGSALRAA